MAPSPTSAAVGVEDRPRRPAGSGWCVPRTVSARASARCIAACSASLIVHHAPSTVGIGPAIAARAVPRSASTACAGILGAVDGRAGDEDVRAGLGGRLDGVGRDPAVDLDEQPQMPGRDVLAGQPHLGQHLGHELLAAEARLDGHHQQGVELAQHVQVRLERGARLDREPGQRAGRADRPGGLPPASAAASTWKVTLAAPASA